MRSSRILGDIVDSAIGSKTHFDMWWAQASEGRRKFVAVQNKHIDFFQASQDAHYVAFFIYFGQLFDKRADASSITNYLKSLERSSDTKLLTELRDRHSVLSARAAPLLNIRHFRVAHVNSQLTETDVFLPLRITWFQIRDAIYDSASFVASLAGAAHVGEVGIPRDGRLAEATEALFLGLAKSDA